MRCQFVPPYLLDRLADVGHGHAADWFGRTRGLDERLRERRATTSPSVAQPPDADGTKTIYSAGGGTSLPGDKVRGDADPPTGDQAVDEAYDSTGIVHELFSTVYGRSGIDDAGSTVTVTVHFGRAYDNAFWDGDQLVFGDGDGEVFERFTKPPDVLFHEFTHGVTQFTADLRYSGQSGALNESVSDCFAAMALQRQFDQTAEQADWLIGEGLFKPSINAVALRSMREPGTAYDDPLLGRDPQVGSMRDYVETTADNGGVHINSGIPNKAFTLAALRLGGYTWERTGRIWYAALTGDAVGRDSGFGEFAAATVAAAGDLYGEEEADAVSAAWEEVGVTPGLDAADAGAPARRSGRIVVSRTGGFTGVVREAAVDADEGPLGAEVASILQQVNFTALPIRDADPRGADRFTYTFAYGDQQVTVPESALTPELERVATLVLGRLADTP
ncbi:M4 family metallopeptidase [Mumia sp. zg.B21]|uniref:protealysin inhibitor emfourin n=1 Tax=Mumia sp. zg.B21 TaxID=2855447 RepID=UPI001C6F2647|nr:protealysin inhibitor emfourin [Mumia sp. zg.B21]MBW9209232.1 M4 family metallopeptidase [Mumia sp. zg.B21]